MRDGSGRQHAATALKFTVATHSQRRAGARGALVASSVLLLGGAVFAPSLGMMSSVHALPLAPRLASFALPGIPRLVAADTAVGRGYVLSWDDPASVQGSRPGLGTHVASIDLRAARMQHAVLVAGSHVGDSSVVLGVDTRTSRVYTVVDAPQLTGVKRLKGGVKMYTYTNDVRVTSFDGRTLRPLHAALTPGLLPQDVVAVAHRVYVGVGGSASGGVQGAQGAALIVLSGTTGTVLRNTKQHAMVWQLGLDAAAGHVLVYSAQVRSSGGWWTRSILTLVDARTGRPLRTIDLGAFPAEVPNDWITVDAVHHRAFAVGRHLLLTLDTRTGRVLARTPVAGNVETLTNDSADGRVIVASTPSPLTGRAFLTVIDGATGRRIGTTQTVTGDRIALGVDSRRQRVLVFTSAPVRSDNLSGRAPQGQLLLMDDWTGRTTATYAWNGAATAVAIDAADDRALVLSDVRVRTTTALALISPRDSAATILDLARL